ncbi:MAG: trypsin-like peptidase domain-containing protein [Lachnospiraceae bacterium]|nr:trypsin-like peptidase domain-containing protein [Lachnospiraceae bacterium]
MRNGIGCLLLNFILAVVSAGQPLQTEEAEPPHLIQTVTEQDIYEGLIWLGALETAVSEEKDCEKAYGNVKGSVVLLHMEDIYGSGVIWDLTPDYVIIASSRHVLEYWEETSGYVRFSQGYFTPGKILYISQEYDVAFLAVDNTEFTYRQLEEMRYVHRDISLYQTLQAGDEMFSVGADVENTEVPLYYKGSIADAWMYIEDFGEYMIYGYGQAEPGMSGGGVFDAKGNLIGLLTGATPDGETAALPLPVIMEAYESARGGL